MNTTAIKSQERRAAFTLNELLIVMALIVLVLALAIPAFNSITNSRSIEAAENQISAYLTIERSEAIGLQQPRGVILFVDAGSDRVTIAQVFYLPPAAPPAVPQPIIDLYPGRDEAVLPVGVGLRAVPNGVVPVDMSTWPRFVVVMFDGDGRLMSDRFTILAGTPLGIRVSTPAGTNPDRLVIGAGTTNQLTHIGFELFDKVAHAEQSPAVAGKWLQDNAVPLLVNRYNGTLLRGQ